MGHPEVPTPPPGARCAHQGCLVPPTYGLVATGWLLWFCPAHLAAHVAPGA